MMFESLFCLIFICQNIVTDAFLEFGNTIALKVPVNQREERVQKLVQFCHSFARDRQPLSVPPPQQMTSQQTVLALQMKRLLYSYDNMEPLVFEQQIRDKFGNVHGISQLFPLGNIYTILLQWKQQSFKFTHNFTLSLYIDGEINVYSHTFVIQNVNSSVKHNYYLPKLNSYSEKPNSLKVHMPENEESIDLFYTGPSNLNSDDMTYSYQGSDDKSNTGIYDGESQPGKFNYLKLNNKQFSVMSFNVWNVNSVLKTKNAYTKRMNRLKQVILDANPDILGLQEVRYESGKGEGLGPSQMDTLSSWFPEYQPAQMQPNTLNDGRTEEGVAIMSKYPIISHDVTMLFINRSNSADTHQRVLLHAQIFIPKLGKVHVFSTHLSLSHEAREQSVIQICNIMKQQQGPAILLADLNAEPNEPAIRYLTGRTPLFDNNPCQLRDVWRESHKPAIKGNTFSALEKHLTKRIDYIIFHQGTSCCQPNSSDVLDNGQRRWEAASDHLPIMANFIFNCSIST